MIIPPSLQTLYADLAQQVHASTVKPASTYVQMSKGARYVYARRNVGLARIDSFIGPENDKETQAAIRSIKIERDLAKQRRKTISLLRRSGIPAPSVELGRVLEALADAGLFRQAVLAGTGAYQCYSPLVGAVLPAASLMTQDADIATASLAIASEESKLSLLEILRRADPTFAPIPGLKRSSAPSAFRSANGFMVDVITPQLRPTDTNPMPLPKLSAGAVPLQHLKWLIEEPTAAVALYGSGIGIKVPQPARYAVHKLIVAQKRLPHERLKRQKDLAQARTLIEALRVSDPHAYDDAIRNAVRQGKRGWSDQIKRSLKELNLS